MIRTRTLRRLAMQHRLQAVVESRKINESGVATKEDLERLNLHYETAEAILAVLKERDGFGKVIIEDDEMLIGRRVS